MPLVPVAVLHGARGVCAEDGHAACATCLEPCGSCGRVVCNRHAEQTHADAPKGRRRLCTACLRYCEGGSRERVGVDEATECASCGKLVCAAHSAVCAVDGQVHCSHTCAVPTRPPPGLRADRAGCAQEEAAIFASDEVGACGSCGKLVCAGHSAECVEDGLRHCVTHLEPLVDATGSYACAAPQRSATWTARCSRRRASRLVPCAARTPAPGIAPRAAIAAGTCCTADLEQPSRRCVTCRQLAVIADPPDDVLTAARAVTGGGRSHPAPGGWPATTVTWSWSSISS